MPFILKWKGHIPEGLTYDPMVSSMDIFHSAISAADIPLPDERKYDGVDLLPYIKGDLKGDPHDILFWQRGYSKAVRTGQWKLLLNEDSGDTLLYDIRNDTLERVDVVSDHRVEAEKLLDMHALWSTALADPLWPSMVHYQFRDGDKLHYFDQ